jgi:voltage-gated potassium channel
VSTLTARRAAAMITVGTMVVTVAAGVLIWLLDHDDFSSLGKGMWWAVQTLTTVGYGDVVPETTTGRLIATVLMLTGIAFITVLTGSVTALLVEQMRQRRFASDAAEEEPDAEPDVLAALENIGRRLDAIEAAMARRDPP